MHGKVGRATSLSPGIPSCVAAGAGPQSAGLPGGEWVGDELDKEQLRREAAVDNWICMSFLQLRRKGRCWGDVVVRSSVVGLELWLSQSSVVKRCWEGAWGVGRLHGEVWVLSLGPTGGSAMNCLWVFNGGNPVPNEHWTILWPAIFVCRKWGYGYSARDIEPCPWSPTKSAMFSFMLWLVVFHSRAKVDNPT